MHNLHISLTEFRNESRALKETQSLVNAGVFSSIHIAALWSEGLAEHETLKDRISLDRFKLASRQYKKNLFFQAVKYIEYCYQVFIKHRKNNIKVVNIHTLSLLPLGVILKHSYGATLVYDAHELETETHDLNGIRKILAKKLEKLLIRSVDLTIVVSEPIADWYQTTYGIRRPVVVLNTPPFIRQPEPSNYFREQFNIAPDQVLFLYQGGLTKGRGIELIIEAFKSRKDDKAVIIFLGYGQLEKHIILAQQNSNNIFFHPAVQSNQLLSYTVSADVGVHFIENTCLNHYYCLPNKLFEYTMVGLPVIVSNMQEMQQFVNQYALGIVAEEPTPEAINQAIDRLLAMDLSQLKNNARQAAIQHSWEVQEKKMLSAYRTLLEKAS